MTMTTHRLLQLHTLEDNMSSKARVARRAARSAFFIKNLKATAYFLERAKRYDRVAARCRGRLA